MTNMLLTLRTALAAFCIYAVSYDFANAANSPTAEPDQISPNLSPQEALAKVEEVILKAYQLELDKYSPPQEQKKLLNAPVDKRRHMLSFAAFNSMGNIANWAVEKGADINIGDADNATMLKMAVINKNMPMVKLALSLGANPDLLSGEGTKLTLLSSISGWPDIYDREVVIIIGLAEKYGAKVSSEQERADLLKRLKSADSRDKIRNYESLKRYLESTGLHSSQHSVKGDELPNNTIGKDTDEKLATSITTSKLSIDVLKSFKSGTNDFLYFLIFNGFKDTLVAYFDSYEQFSTEPLKYELSRWNDSGNNALFAALKSLNLFIVERVLGRYHDNINEAAPDKKEFYSYNRKARPLGIAIAWGASDDILKLLMDYGANPDLDVGSYPQLRKHTTQERNAFDLINESVQLGYTTKERAEEMKKVLKGGRP